MSEQNGTFTATQRASDDLRAESINPKDLTLKRTVNPYRAHTRCTPSPSTIRLAGNVQTAALRRNEVLKMNLNCAAVDAANGHVGGVDGGGAGDGMSGERAHRPDSGVR